MRYFCPYNKVGYLRGLVNAVNNGTFTAPDTAQAAEQKTAAPILFAAKTKKRLKEQQESKVDNSAYFAMLKVKFGDRIKVPGVEL